MIPEPYVRWLSSYFFISGMDPDDIAQEARLAAWRAGPGLERLAARRRVIELLRASQRRPQFALLTEHHRERIATEDVIEQRERLRAVLRVVRDDLSDLERDALAHVASGGEQNVKSIDNAVGRARRKLRAAA